MWINFKLSFQIYRQIIFFNEWTKVYFMSFVYDFEMFDIIEIWDVLAK